MQRSFLKWKYVRQCVYLSGGLLFVYAWLVGTHIELSLVTIFATVAIGLFLAYESYLIQKNDPPKTRIKNKKVAGVIATFILWIFFMVILFTLFALSGNSHAEHHGTIWPYLTYV